MLTQPITIDPEFRDLIPPQSPDERRGLEEDIIAEGCRVPLTLWRGHGILVDGHTRYAICQKNTIPFEVEELEFADRDAAKIFIIRNQLNRRNLQPMVRVELVIKLEPLLTAKAKENQRLSGGKGAQKSADLKVQPMETREELAKLAGVSRDTVSKVQKINASPVKELGRMTRAGDVSINAAAAVAELPIERQTWVVDAGPEAVKEAAKEAIEKKRAGRDADSGDEQDKPDMPQSRGSGLDWAHKAIALLQKIPPNDGLRKEALELVVRWCKHNAKEST